MHTRKASLKISQLIDTCPMIEWKHGVRKCRQLNENGNCLPWSKSSHNHISEFCNFPIQTSTRYAYPIVWFFFQPRGPVVNSWGYFRYGLRYGIEQAERGKRRRMREGGICWCEGGIGMRQKSFRRVSSASLGTLSKIFYRKYPDSRGE